MGRYACLWMARIPFKSSIICWITSTWGPVKALFQQFLNGWTQQPFICLKWKRFKTESTMRQLASPIIDVVSDWQLTWFDTWSSLISQLLASTSREGSQNHTNSLYRMKWSSGWRAKQYFVQRRRFIYRCCPSLSFYILLFFNVKCFLFLIKTPPS